ncbi:hypothetical protein CKO44_21540 [Rubrivivax gelatinosus]|uniref:Transmembrane protein n=1 Tax=Rubrivivax gelatinosus TaxID=28068 RepID=A0ABS1E163_RUBGE|nr:DUF6622 family protein [Rubrivivax gelatinosus]MBK1616041.1 hypothetical protein [Rubrivivax gelatinosus]MBK1715438.1 hypothetical protein [Rubrivivax gelatinosus]
MFLDILQHTPRWVFVLLALLVWLGLRASRPHSASLRRCVAAPLALAVVSLLGSIDAFGARPLALLAWALALAAAVGLQQRRVDTSRVQFSAETGRFELPGSWLPLVLMLAIFAVKFAAGVTLALRPDSRQWLPFVLGISAAYGMFSGIFLGRATALWTLARRTTAPLRQAA